MESAVENSEAGSEPVGEKRAAEEELGVLKDAPPTKRSRGPGERRLVGDVRKVAEMVLVLAAMGKMRGGKGPSDVEKGLMAEARDKLAKVCEGFAPKDVFPRDAFGGVIEDLGLNKLKEQRLGFRPPKMSIAEKLLVSKRKMEKAENFSLPSTPHSSRLHPNSGSAVESRNMAHPVRMPQPEKSSHISMSSGSFQSPSPLAHTTAANTAPLPYQLPTSEIRPVVSSALPSGHLNSAALPRVSHLRSDGRPNGSPHPPQIQANYSANSSVRTPTWSVQPQPALSKPASDNKVPVNMSLRVEGTAGVISGLAPQTTARAVASQMLGPPSQGTSHVQPPSLGNTHAEVGKIVQKLLQPRVSDRPTWIPPSRDYMSKALTCQICMSMVTEIDSILICDACEKGYHLKCLQTNNPKGVPRGEWHCGKCLSLSNGKPLPPKYGRVMRNVNTPKVSSNSETTPSTPSKLHGASDDKVSQMKVMVNGNATMENCSSGVVGNNYSHQTSGPERKESKEMQENDNASIGTKMDDMISSGTSPNNFMKTSSAANVSSVNSSDEKRDVVKVSDMKLNSSTEPVMVLSSSDKSQAIPNAVEANTSKQPLENHFVVRDSKESHGNESSNNTNHLKEQEVVHDNPPEIAAKAGAMDQHNSSSESLHPVNWVGDPIQILDGKVYYPSCCVSGHLYKLRDHVLIRFDNDKLVPSKLQAMWEDKTTTAKWVMVNQCYFPGDLPEAVGRPCGLESSEVYESTCSRSLMAGSIEGPCEVLPPRRFAEESDRRIRSDRQINDRLPPLYLCNHGGCSDEPLCPQHVIISEDAKNGYMMKQKGYSGIFPVKECCRVISLCVTGSKSGTFTVKQDAQIQFCVQYLALNCSL
ncbi:hypothetical protein C2S53_003514 [Perilla frutescens var. hirtella]|uniref:PHD finger protein n=1 Tax=Perilla frutescens var. hirtella TaxID=608512 RepID=A0AAD4P1K1_PERFH|nr:hypothetical protein C2S53_003514 [Perilla frutescens var. hirtella]